MARSSSESDEERSRRHRDRHRSSRHKSKRSQRSRSSSRSRHRRRRSRERSRDRRRRHRSRSDSRRRRRRSSSSPSSERGSSARHSKPASKQASPSPPPQTAAAVSLQADDPASRASAIAAIEEDGFVQHAFLSGKGRITGGWGEKGLSTDEKETLANMAAAGTDGGEEEAICHPKLSEGVQEKTDQWVKKILTIRQKLMAAGSGLS